MLACDCQVWSLGERRNSHVTAAGGFGLVDEVWEAGGDNIEGRLV